jgi:hypothetical protein
MFIFWLYISYIHIYLKYPIVDSFTVLPKYQTNLLTLNALSLFGLEGVKIYFTLDLFGLVLLTLAYAVGFISILALDTRLYYKNINYLFAFNVFVLIVYFCYLIFFGFLSFVNFFVFEF